MFHEMVFKASIFGDFDNIKPIPETIMALLEEFAEFGVIPSTFIETNSGISILAVANILPPVTKNRLRLSSERERMDIFIFSNRIDTSFVPEDFTGFSDEEIHNLIKKTEIIFEQLLNKYTKSASRLALNTTTLLIDLQDEQRSAFLRKFIMDESYFSNPRDWSTHLMKRESIKLNENQDTLNVIANIATAIGQGGKDNESRDFNGFSIDFDINTVPENTAPRFTLPEIRDFLDQTVALKKRLISDLTSGIG
jgi:arsenate reductase-like glutaredoxin family protein